MSALQSLKYPSGRALRYLWDKSQLLYLYVTEHLFEDSL